MGDFASNSSSCIDVIAYVKGRKGLKRFMLPERHTIIRPEIYENKDDGFLIFLFNMMSLVCTKAQY